MLATLYEKFSYKIFIYQRMLVVRNFSATKIWCYKVCNFWGMQFLWFLAVKFHRENLVSSKWRAGYMWTHLTIASEDDLTSYSCWGSLSSCCLVQLTTFYVGASLIQHRLLDQMPLEVKHDAMSLYIFRPIMCAPCVVKNICDTQCTK